MLKDLILVSVQQWDSNKTDDYSLAVRFDENSALFNINDNEFDKYFTDCAKEEFELKFIEKNMAEVNHSRNRK